MFDHLRQPHAINENRYSHLEPDYFYEKSDEESDECEDELKATRAREHQFKNECNQCGYVMICKSVGGNLVEYYHNRNWHVNGKFKCSWCDAVFVEDWQHAYHLELKHCVKSVKECQLCFKSHPFFKTSNVRVGSFHGSNVSRMANRNKRRKSMAIDEILSAYPNGATLDQSLAIMQKQWPQITKQQVSKILKEFNLSTWVRLQ